MSGAGGIGSFLGFGISVAGIGLVAAMVLWIFSIGELAVMSCWAVTNAREARAREDRRLEREIREREAQHARLGSLPPLEMFHRPQRGLVTMPRSPSNRVRNARPQTGST